MFKVVSAHCWLKHLLLSFIFWFPAQLWLLTEDQKANLWKAEKEDEGWTTYGMVRLVNKNVKLTFVGVIGTVCILYFKNKHSNKSKENSIYTVVSMVDLSYY